MAQREEIDLLRGSGLLPHDLGKLTLAREDPGERISGVEIQKLMAEAHVTDDELISPAERAWKMGDWAAAVDADKDKPH